MLRGTPYNDPAVRAQSWSTIAKAYRRRTIALDGLTSALTLLPLVLLVQGVGLSALLVPLAVGVAFGALVASVRGYETRWLGDGPEEFQAIFRAGAIGAAAVITFSYAGSVDVSRVLVFVGTPLLLLTTSGVRYVHRRFLHHSRAAGSSMKRTLVVGERADVERVSAELAGSSYHGYEMVGVCLPAVLGPRKLGGLPVVGALADVAQVSADRAIDVVVVAGPGLSGEGLRRLTWALDRLGTQMVVVPDLVEVAGPRVTVRPAAGLSLLEVEVGAPRGRLVLKALLDRVAGVVLTVLAVFVTPAAVAQTGADAVWTIERLMERMGVVQSARARFTSATMALRTSSTEATGASKARRAALGPRAVVRDRSKP